MFSAISDEVLRDYVEAGHTVNAAGQASTAVQRRGRLASTDRSQNDARVARLTCPVHIVAGDTSNVLTPATLEWARRLNPRISSVMLPGGHLLPLESPGLCAEQTLAFIDGQGS